MANNTVVVTKDHMVNVSINGKTESYDLTSPISEKSVVVLREKNDVLHQMDLQTVITNLDNSVDLLDVAYHAVYGFKEQSKIYGLQKTLMDLNDNGISVIGEFKTKSASITQELAGIFRWLTKGAETVAIGKLIKFSQYAQGMSEQAEKLAQDYERMAESTSTVLTSTMDESTRQYEKADELKKQLADFQAEQEKADITQKSIEKRLKDLKKEYNRLSAAEERDDKQRNTMAIVGAVFSFLGRAVSVAGDAMGSGSGGVSQGSQTSENKEELEKKKKEEAENASRIEQLKKEIAELDQNIKDGVEQKEKAEEDTKKELETSIEGWRKEYREKKQQLEELEKKQETLKGVISNIGRLLSGTGEDIREAESGTSLAEMRSERMKEIYDELIRLEEENTKQLGMLAEYTKKMEATVIDQNSIGAAIQALIIAISCLKRVVVAVKDIALFWNAMEQCCKSLAESSLLDDIKSLQEIEDKEERISYYYDKDVMYPLLCYAAKWTAVYSISSEYISAAEKTRFRLRDTITSADSLEMKDKESHWEKAARLAGDVSERLGLQVAESQDKIKAFERQKNE